MSKAAWTAWAVKNSVAVICCTVLAIHFNHWWIVLFAILLTSSLAPKWIPSRICDGCGKTIYADDLDIDRAMQRAGWIRKKRGDKWEDFCPKCQETLGICETGSAWQSHSEKLREERHDY